MPLLQILMQAHHAHYNRYQFGKPPKSPSPSVQEVSALLHHMSLNHIKWLTQYGASGLNRLVHLQPPPPVLFYRGSLNPLLLPTVTVVGTRRPSSQGSLLAQQTGVLLSKLGCCVVSGMARGVDGLALRGAYRHSHYFPAVAVLGTAITQCYPANHFGLYQALCQSGLVVSEYPPGFTTQPFHFLLRNEIMAALGDIIVVVEAGEKSGTFHTVTAALNLGKLVLTFSLPALGNQKLLDEGAQQIHKPEDIVPILHRFLHQQLKES